MFCARTQGGMRPHPRRLLTELICAVHRLPTQMKIWTTRKALYSYLGWRALPAASFIGSFFSATTAGSENAT
ncbi:hypothetical protein FOMPIDRAFT_1022919 [Fomitopsis schrenkii]|uniref:Uncharacterized protein n=1 Tax=Fomitopsis schrenkii TaxID=2126942 RepID=S8FLS0_FOMSC|nr:hypothetical protein FOMPIDRAFT_1022919 [Fomitopsis schrenkii]